MVLYIIYAQCINILYIIFIVNKISFSAFSNMYALSLFNISFLQESGIKVNNVSIIIPISLLISNVFLLGASSAYLSECGFFDDQLIHGYLKSTDFASWTNWSIAGTVFLMVGCLASIVYKFMKNIMIVYAYAGMLVLGWILVTIAMFIAVTSNQYSFEYVGYSSKVSDLLFIISGI